MKVVTILGSARRHGNTATVLGWVEEELRRSGHTVDRANVVDLKVNGCLGCRTCKKVRNQLGCVQRDDVPGIFFRLMSADALLLATPIYGWGFPGQMKCLLDRAYMLTKGTRGVDYISLVAGRRLALLATCGGVYENNADLMDESFKRLANYTLMVPTASLILTRCTTADKLGEEAKAQASTLAGKIVAPLLTAAA